MIRRTVIVACVAALLAACGSREVLQPRSPTVPAGIDFSGQWLLREDSADTVEEISAAERRAAGGDERIQLIPDESRRGRRSRDKLGALVHVFLETGHALKITQTAHGLFISFDRAVVEEFRFGEQREVSVGPVVADRVSGWEGATYVVETLDEDGAKLVETYRLVEAGAALERRIVIRHGDKRELDLTQLFDRG